MIATRHSTNGNVRHDTIGYFFENEKTAMMIHGRRNEPDKRMVFNPSDTTITCLFEMNGRKSGYVLPMDEEHWPGMPSAMRPYGAGPRSKLNYTGKEKKIEGFLCKEVMAEDDEYSAKLWLAEDIRLSMTRVLSYQSVGKGKSKKEIELFDQFGVEGLPLEMNLRSRKGKADVELKLVHLSDSFDRAVFSSQGHEVSRIGQ